MSYRKRTVIIALVVLLAIAAELAYRRSNHGKGAVSIVNQTGSGLENLVVSYEGTRLAVGRLAPGKSTTVRFTAGGAGTLGLDYDLKGSPVQGFQISDFDPAQLLHDSFKLVLTVRDNEVERGMEDDEKNPQNQSLIDLTMDWVRWAVSNP